MGLRSSAYPFARQYPDAAMRLIRSARINEITGFREQVYLFQGSDVFSKPIAVAHKVGRSRLPAERIKQVRTKAMTIRDWREVHCVTCCSEQRITPSPGDTLEGLLHGIFAPYQTAMSLGREYFALSPDAIAFFKSLSIIDALTLNIAVLDAVHSGDY